MHPCSCASTVPPQSSAPAGLHIRHKLLRQRIQLLHGWTGGCESHQGRAWLAPRSVAGWRPLHKLRWADEAALPARALSNDAHAVGVICSRQRGSSHVWRTLMEEACSKRARSSGDRMMDSLPATAGRAAAGAAHGRPSRVVPQRCRVSGRRSAVPLLAVPGHALLGNNTFGCAPMNGQATASRCRRWGPSLASPSSRLPPMQQPTPCLPPPQQRTAADVDDAPARRHQLLERLRDGDGAVVVDAKGRPRLVWPKHVAVVRKACRGSAGGWQGVSHDRAGRLPAGLCSR